MTTKNKHLHLWLLLLCAMLMPSTMQAADGLFDTPKQAFKWESGTPGCIHLKILMSQNSAGRYLKEATFYVKDSEGKKTNFFYAHETNSSTSGQVIGTYRNLLASSTCMFMTNGTNGDPKWIINGSDTQHYTLRDGTNPGYIEIDWYWPIEFAGKRYKWGVDGKLYNNGSTPTYSKEIGDIEFDEITFETFDAIIGMNEGEEGTVTIPFMSDKPINWVEGTYTNIYGTQCTYKETLPEKTYNGFLRIPACDTHKAMSITANVTTASWTDQHDGDPDHNTGNISKTLGDVATIHAPIAFTAEALDDGKGSVMLTWRIDNVGYADILDGDVFQIQRSLTGKEEDFEDLTEEPFDAKQEFYSFKDSLLIENLKQENIDAELGIPLVRYRIRRASTSTWGWMNNPTVAYEQPQFKSMHLLQPIDLKSEWLNEEEFTVKLDWNYAPSTDHIQYVWDEYAEMSMQMILYNRQGIVVDTITHVLSAEERNTKTLQMTLTKPCNYYEFRLYVNAQNSPVGNPTGNLYDMKIRSEEDFKEFAQRVNNGETSLNAILLEGINYNSAKNTIVGNSADKPYCGVFEGNDMILYYNIDATGEALAPFRYTGNGVRIRNVHFRTTVTTSKKFASNIVGQHLNGLGFIEHCFNDGDIVSTLNGDGSHGSIVGFVDRGTMFINKCESRLKITGNYTINCGGFVGWRRPEAFVNIMNSLVDNRLSTVSTGCMAFMRQAADNTVGIKGLITNSYYYSLFGTAQGGKYSEIGSTNEERSKKMGWLNNNAYYTSINFQKSLPYSITEENDIIRKDVKQPTFRVLSTSGETSGYFGASNLFDGNLKTEWYQTSSNKVDGVWYVEFEANEKFCPFDLIFTTYTIGKNYPKSWVLKGKLNSDDSWKVLHQATDDETILPVESTPFYFPILSSNEYKYFRLEISKSSDPESKYLDLSELAITKFNKGHYYFETIGQIMPTLRWRELQNSVLLQWDTDEKPIDYFEVMRRTKGSKEGWEVIESNISGQEYEDKSTSPVYTYYYKVRAVNNCEGVTYTYTDSIEGHCVQTGTVEGYVRFADGTGIADVLVSVSPSQDHPASVKTKTARTDESGYYKIEDLLYYTQQSGPYDVSVNIASDDLSPDCAKGLNVTFDTKSNYSSNVTFTVTKGYKISGYVMFDGTSIPVPGVNFTVNGREVRAGGKPVETDFQGKFSFYLLGGETTVQAKKEGHTFWNDGIYTHNFTTDKAQIYFYDTKRVKLIGRVVGGRDQGDLPLGNSLSRNNLGENLTITMALEGDNTSWLVYDNLNALLKERDTVYVHKAHDKKYTYQTTTHTTRHRIDIKPDKYTGEYCVELPPVKWKIQQIYAQGYPTLFQEGKTGDVIDLTDSLTVHRETVSGHWLSLGGNDVTEATIEYNAQYNRIYHSPVQIDYKQVGYDKFDFMGDKQYIAKNLGGDRSVVPLVYADSVTNEAIYTFGHPVFSIEKKYLFQLSAHEKYYWNNNQKTDTIDVVQMKGGVVTIQNGMMGTSHRETVELDDNGEGTTFIQAAQTPYLRTGDMALSTVSMTLELDGTYYEAKPLNAYVLNVVSKEGAKDILTYSKPELVDILRDPPGGGSSAKISKGSTLKYSYQMDMSWKAGFSLGITAGNKFSSFTGVVAAPMGAGAVGGFTNNASSKFATSIDLVWSGSGQRAFSYTMTTTEDISTSSHKKVISSDGDVYIGMEQNIVVKPATAIRAIPDSVFILKGGELKAGRMIEIASGRDQNDSLYHLVREEVITYGPQFKSTFAHSQHYIINQLIPELTEQCRALMFTGTEEEAQKQADNTGKLVYLSTVNKDSDEFGVRYKLIKPGDADGSEVDEVARFHNCLLTWAGMIAQNEKEKLEAKELVQNFDVDGASPMSYSEEFTSEYSITKSFSSPISAGTVEYFDNTHGDNALGALQVLGPIAAKLLGSLLNGQAGHTDGSATGTSQGDESEVAIDCVGWTFKFNLTPIVSFNVVPKNTESKKYNRKESFSISMDRKSHIDFDVYRVNTQTDNVQNSGVLDVFTEDNFYDLVDYNEAYLKRELNMKDIRYARSFVYRTRGGATCRPYEGKRTTIFYQPGTLLDEPTKRIEKPTIWLDNQSVSGVPHDEPARFTVHMANESEQPEAAYTFFNICLDETSNAKGARVLMDGAPLTGSPRTMPIPVGEVITKTIEVYAGEDFDYEDLAIVLLSLDDEDTNSSTKFSVHYLRSAGSVAISTPGDKWIMNTDAQKDARGYYMPVVISDFNKNQKNFDHIEFQYKESTRGDDYWTNLCSFYAKDSLMALASGTKAMIPENGYIITEFYGEGVEIEKAYDLRAVLFCRNGNEYLTSSSKVLSGIKDTRLPQLFDTPEPKDGILGIGDNVVFNFSEAIEHNYLSAITNFEVMGETNETNIQEEPSLLFEGRGFAQTEARRNCNNKSVTVEMMIMPDQTGKDMPIFTHGSDGVNAELWITADKRLKVVLDDTTFVSTYKVEGSGFHHIAMVLNNDTKELELYNDSLIGRFNNVSYNGFGPFVFGSTNEPDVSKRSHYSGRMLETRIWNRAMTYGQLYQTYANRQLTGYEMGLIGYYPMNEGDGKMLTDKAHGAHAAITNGSWALPQGMSLALDWHEDKEVKGMQLKGDFIGRPQEADYTLMFWFKTNERGRGALISNGSGRTTDVHAKDNFFIGFEGPDLKYRTNGMELIIPGSYSDDNWHHYAMTVNRARNIGNIYVDRELRASFRTDTLGGINGNDVFLGNMVWYEQGTENANARHQENALTGYLDEICLFEQALPSTLIKRYSTKSPSGNEKGLITYLGFNRQEKNKENDIVLMPYALNQRNKTDMDGNIINEHDSVFVDPISTVLAHINTTNGAPVQAYQDLKNLNFSFVGRDNQLMVNLNEQDARINKRTIYVTVSEIPDMNGNYMASPSTVSLFVDRNPLRWETKTKYEYVYEGYGSTFTAKIINTSGASHTYELKGLPNWLTADKLSGIIDPMGEENINFTVDKGVNVGSYDEILYVVDENGLYEPMLLTQEVKGNGPNSLVDDALKQYSMNIVGRVLINDAIVTDSRDVVCVYDKAGRLMGGNNISYDPETAQSMLYLTVYDSTAVEKELYFKLWHYQTGKTMMLQTDSPINFAPSHIEGTVKDPIVMRAGELYIQRLDMVPGWNWISLNIYNNNFRNINKVLGAFSWENGDILTDDSDGLTLIYKNGQWLSNRDESISNAYITPAKSYRVKVKNYISIELTGNSLKQKALRSIKVKPGWNSIGYTPMVILDTETALADFYSYAQEGDVIKSQEEFAMFTKGAYEKGEWVGSLKYMEPGEGYMLKSNGKDTVQFFYPYHEPGSTFISTSQKAPHKRASHTYPTTMTMAAKVTGVTLEEGDKLVAICDGEVCGEADCNDEVIYLCISGQKKAPVSFVIERDDEWVAATHDIMTFEANAVSGSPMEPTEINFVSNLSDLLSQQGWFTLQGVKLDTKPTKKGVYIYNGKKQIVK